MEETQRVSFFRFLAVFAACSLTINAVESTCPYGCDLNHCCVNGACRERIKKGESCNLADIHANRVCPCHIGYVCIEIDKEFKCHDHSTVSISSSPGAPDSGLTPCYNNKCDLQHCCIDGFCHVRLSSGEMCSLPDIHAGRACPCQIGFVCMEANKLLKRQRRSRVNSSSLRLTERGNSRPSAGRNVKLGRRKKEFRCRPHNGYSPDSDAMTTQPPYIPASTTTTIITTTLPLPTAAIATTTPPPPTTTPIPPTTTTTVPPATTPEPMNSANMIPTTPGAHRSPKPDGGYPEPHKPAENTRTTAGPHSMREPEAATPRPDREIPTPRPDREGPTPRPDRESPIPRPDRESPTPRPDREGPTPRPDREGPTPRPEREGPTQRPDRAGLTPRPNRASTTPLPTSSPFAPDSPWEPTPAPRNKRPRSYPSGTQQ